jgi:hypothetical protein
MAPQLLATTGPLSGQTLTLQPGESTLGREVGNTIVIDDQAVSRRHAKIMVINGVATVEDAGSSDGTWVNDLRITAPTLLKVGDSLRLGGTVFSFLPMSVVAPDLGQRRPREKSRYQEAPAPFATPVNPNANSGCMPDMNQMMTDLQGCLGPLMRYLIIALIIILVLCLLGALIAGIGAIGAISAASSGAAASGSAASDSGGGGGQAGGQPPPPDQKSAQQPPPPAQATANIEIVKVRVAYLKREGYSQPQPVVLVTWRNRSDQAVSELDGDIKGFDSANRPVGLVKNATLFKGQPVKPNETHEDAETEGNLFPVDTPQGQAPPILDHAELDKLLIR